MHPGQFTVINSQLRAVLENSMRDLVYHSQILDALGLDASAKIQLHVGGVYGNKERSIARFIERYRNLDERIKRRLVIENDDRSYTLRDCMRIHSEIDVPILFDVLHHEVNTSGESISDALRLIAGTWKPEDGIPMVDYSYPQKGEVKVSHAESIDLVHFERFLAQTRPCDFDVMLEIKDKETSALKAVQLAKADGRFFTR
jgi:UV DNA damage endonuclease